MENEAQEAVFTEVTTPKLVLFLRKYWQILSGVLLLILIISVTIKLIPQKKPLAENALVEKNTSFKENNDFSAARIDLLENKINNLEAQVKSLSTQLAENVIENNVQASEEGATEEPEKVLQTQEAKIIEPVIQQEDVDKTDAKLLYYELKEKLLAGENFSDVVDRLINSELNIDAQNNNAQNNNAQNNNAQNNNELENALQILLAGGTKPISTADELQKSFKQARDNWENQTENKDIASASLFSQTANNLKSLVKIRKIGQTHQGADSASIIARAEYAVQKQDIAQSLKELKNLPKNDEIYFVNWREQALYQQKIMSAFNELRQAILGEKHYD